MTKKTPNQAEIAVNINPDKTPILYAEHLFIHSSVNGVTLDIGQKVGPTNKVHIVSRLAMSRDQAKNFLQELGKVLAITESKKTKQ